MIDWDRVRVFHAVAQAGSFTRAAEKLGLSQSAISRQIGALEEDLGTPLFHRHARGLVLTEQGEILLETALDMAKRMAAAQTSLSESRDTPAGDLTVNATVGFGSVWLTAQLAEFLDRYPDIRHLADRDRQRSRPQHARGRRRDPHATADASPT